MSRGPTRTELDRLWRTGAWSIGSFATLQTCRMLADEIDLLRARLEKLDHQDHDALAKRAARVRRLLTRRGRRL